MRIRYNRKLRTKDIVVVALIAIVSVIAIAKYQFLQDSFEHEIERYGAAGVLVISFLLEFVPQFLHPFTTVILAVGLGASILTMTALSTLGSFLGAVIGFEVGRKFGFHVICPFLDRKSLGQTLENIDRYGAIFILVAAILPLPYLPVVFGSLGIHRKTFWLYGIFPRAACFLALGMLLYFGVKLF